MSRSTHWASSGGCPNSIQGRNPGTCCTCCVTKNNWEPSVCSRTQIRVPLARLPLTLRNRQARLLGCLARVDWRGERPSVVFSDASRICRMRVMDVHLYGIDLVSVIFRNAFVHDTKPPTQASWSGDNQFRLGHVWCFCSVK